MTRPRTTLVENASVTETWKPAAVRRAAATSRVLPTTCGTGWGGGPWLTTTCTASPWGSWPEAGSWLITTSAGTVSS